VKNVIKIQNPVSKIELRLCDTEAGYINDSKMKVLGISSGGGVSLYPFKKYVVGNVESRSVFHTPANVQWNLNYPGVHLERTVQDMRAKMPDEDIDLVISSPDCGNGSILRLSVAKTYGDYKNNPSLEAFFEGINLFGPKFFYFENLEKFFKSVEESKFKERLGNNYRLIKHIASVANWGNSQIHRKRLVVIGIRKDLPKKIDKYFKLPYKQEKNKTCFELYGDLDNIPHETAVELAHIRENFSDETTIHSGRKIPNHEITQIWNNELKGKRRWEVKGRKFTTAPGVYRNRKNDYPATARKASRQYDHRGLMLTPRQLARIQGVPDSFQIYIDPKRAGYWINKGRVLVTKSPPMEISVWLRKKLEKLKSLNYV
jgi:site-specific DNA-cytosine methylase